MGISIHYKGKLNKPELLNDLINEMAAISKETKWEYELVDDKIQNVKGIITKPHIKSESFSLLFNKNLDLVSLASLILEANNNTGPHVESIKTQYAPLEIHISVIKLLKYFKSKYIANMEVFDEGNYWDTLDEQVLKKNMNFLSSRINMVADILEAHQDDLDKADTPDNLVDRIEEIIRKFRF